MGAEERATAPTPAGDASVLKPARDEILARVRTATVGAVSPHVPSLTPSGPVSVDLFVERVADYKAVVERCTPATLRDHVLAAVDGSTVVVPAGLGVDVPGAVVDGADGRVLSAADLDAIDTVVTEASVGIAETGTIVLTHGPGQGRRALTLVPDRFVCIVRAEQVVADVPDAVPLLDPHRPQTWVSGPSATSDIELDRVEGVHGPRVLHVILVEG
jgi:L-lactate dehydrogenase complex protein LldG